MNNIAVVCKEFEDFAAYIKDKFHIEITIPKVKLDKSVYIAVFSTKMLRSKSFKGVCYTDFAYQNPNLLEIDKIIHENIRS